ncbi:sensor histidine kinase [Paenibacillus nasutitermitis]|uniref:histidine kinase n=1 Tax=Paenibacillus nasutitermitis TaxID=1652958 RepID=A0A916YYR9_9BACL|nr:HAMP domain-containing sensor histidine kinase [Paenibacillus nasutitermitis]GGD67429.1 hypothetical protein GCM10010911_26530 [Paenibacillus nasutitermitis]
MKSKIKVLDGFLLISLLLAICWSIAYTIVVYASERSNEPESLSTLMHDGQLMVQIAASGKKPDEQAWQAIARQNGYRLLLIDGAGATMSYGEKAERFLENPEENDISAVMSGGTIEHIKRTHLFGKGVAMVGLPITVQDKQQALFIQSELPGIYNHYGKGILIQLLSFVVLVLLLLCFRPWRRDMRGWMQIIEAIRKIAKGDFTVVIRADEPIPGQFRELVTSINDMAVELNQMEQMRQTFISNVSHEIQSPLTSIRGFAQALQQEEGLDEKQRKHFYQIIETESSRLSKLSDNLLKLTTLESDKHPIDLKSYRLDKQIRSIILACEPQWLDKELFMDIELGEIRITADEDLLSQVWMNLLSNSIKFTPNGGTISIEAGKRDGRAEVRISDNGIGIDQADIPFIFDRFFKGDKSRNRQISGSGLGLSIVKRIIDMHGGEIGVTSTLGSGTTITVMLPSPDRDSTP